MSRTCIYRVWNAMMQRCYNPNNKYYADYGARGITVCERWHRFENFYADVGDPPSGMSLDRPNNNDLYAPWNFRWATPAMQTANRRPQRTRRRANTEAIRAFAKSLTRAASSPVESTS
jgi:hypothetical protein